MIQLSLTLMGILALMTSITCAVINLRSQSDRFSHLGMIATDFDCQNVESIIIAGAIQEQSITTKLAPEKSPPCMLPRSATGPRNLDVKGLFLEALAVCQNRDC